MNELSAIEHWAGALLAQLSPAGRRAATRDIARELRRSQQARIATQRNPDGSPFEPRKRKAGGKNLRDKRGRVKRTTMFKNLRTTRYLRTETDANGLATGFAGRVSRIARVHQFGERERLSPNGPEYRYPARLLLGFTERDREMIRDVLLRHFTN